MATVGTLVVNLTARSSGFRKGVRSARTTLVDFTKTAVGAIGKITALGGALSAVGIGLFIKQQFAAVDGLAKVADRIGTTTEALAGLRHGAGLAGTETAVLDKSLEVLSRNLGEAASGIGSQAKGALAELGLDATELTKIPLPQALGQIADRINQLGTQAEKAAVANKLFGRGGVSLLNMLAEGSAGIKEMQAEAEKLGIAINRTDAAAIERANDAVDRMKAVFVGMAQQAAVALAPLIEEAAPKIAEFAIKFAKEWLPAIIEVGKDVGSILVESFKAVASVLETVNALGEALIGKFDKLAEVGPEMARGFTDFMGGGINDLFGGGRRDEAPKGFAPDAQQRIDAFKQQEKQRLAREQFIRNQPAIMAGLGTMGIGGFRGKEFQAGGGVGLPLGFGTQIGVEMAAELAKQRGALQPESDSLRQSLRTAGEIFADDMKRLGELFNAGAIDDETLQRGTLAALERREEAKGDEDQPSRGGGLRFSSGVEAGSRDAFDLLAESLRGGPEKDAQQKTAENTAKLREESAAMVAELQAIRRQLGGSDNPKVVSFN